MSVHNYPVFKFDLLNQMQGYPFAHLLVKFDAYYKKCEILKKNNRMILVDRDKNTDK